MSAATHTFPSVRIGPTDHDVVPQKIGRLRATLDRAITSVQGQEVNFDSPAGFLSAGPEAVHPFLSIFYPKLMPLWQFAGYGTQDAYERSLPKPVINAETGEQDVDPETGDLLWSPGEGTYDESVDESPDPHQIVEAFKAGFAANDLDLAKGLIGWVPFDEGKAWVRIKVGEWLDGERAAARARLSAMTNSSSDS